MDSTFDLPKFLEQELQLQQRRRQEPISELDLQSWKLPDSPQSRQSASALLQQAEQQWDLLGLLHRPPNDSEHDLQRVARKEQKLHANQLEEKWLREQQQQRLARRRVEQEAQDWVKQQLAQHMGQRETTLEEDGQRQEEQQKAQHSAACEAASQQEAWLLQAISQHEVREWRLKLQSERELQPELDNELPVEMQHGLQHQRQQCHQASSDLARQEDTQLQDVQPQQDQQPELSQQAEHEPEDEDELLEPMALLALPEEEDELREPVALSAVFCESPQPDEQTATGRAEIAEQSGSACSSFHDLATMSQAMRELQDATWGFDVPRLQKAMARAKAVGVNDPATISLAEMVLRRGLAKRQAEQELEAASTSRDGQRLAAALAAARDVGQGEGCGDCLAGGLRS